jgi:hypothetical protein
MIYIYTLQCISHFFEDYINSILFTYKSLYTDKKIEYILDLSILEKKINEKNNEDRFLFLQKVFIPVDMNDERIYLINTEQLTKKEWVNILKNYSKNIKIVDYSLINIYFLQPHRQPIYYLPYTVNINEIYNLPKKHDLCTIGCWGDVYRNNITDQLIKNGVKINHIEKFGKERDEFLFQHKILVNVHFNENFKVFEEMRCNRCIMNKMIIITEKSENIIKSNSDAFQKLKKHMIECDYNKLVETAMDVLNNYEKYYNILFNDFNIEDIKKEYEKEFMCFFDSI